MIHFQSKARCPCESPYIVDNTPKYTFVNRLSCLQWHENQYSQRQNCLLHISILDFLTWMKLCLIISKAIILYAMAFTTLYNKVMQHMLNLWQERTSTWNPESLCSSPKFYKESQKHEYVVLTNVFFRC